MPAPGQSWPLNFKVISCIFHSIAISSGIFRSTYRWSICRFGWEDTWAVIALLFDVGCLICSWLQQSSPSQLSKTNTILNFVSTVTLTSVPWAARLSMITTIIRIVDLRAGIKRASYTIAVSFGVMWMAVLAQKLYLTTDVVSDALLVVMPVFFLQGLRIPRTQRLLLVLSFGSSICISVVSIAQSVSLFMPLSGCSILFIQIKAALATLICNLLIIVIFAYRFWNKSEIDPGTHTKSDPIQLTTIIPGRSTPEIISCSTPSSFV